MSRALIKELQNHGISLWVDGGRLHFRAPAGALTAALKNRIREQKTELIALLSAPGGARNTPAPAALLPLSHEQLRIWFLTTHAGAESAFNVPAALLWRGAFDCARLQAALTSVCAGHECLRSRFVVHDGKPRRAVADGVQAPLRMVDLTACDEASRRATLDAQLAGELAEPFALDRAPLVRASVYTLTPTLRVVHFVFHHIVFDAESAVIFLRDLASAYAGDDRQPEPGSNADRYADYVRWQRTALAPGARAAALRFWSDRLAHLPALHGLVTDFPRPASFAYAGATRHAVIDAATTARLRTLAQELRVTMFALLQTVFVVLLHKLGDTRDTVVGTPVSTRHEAGHSNSIGLFSNLLVLRNRVDETQPFHDLVRQVHADTLEALAHQHLPFDLLVDHLRPSRDLSHTPLFQIAFAYHRVADLQLGDAAASVEPYYYDGASVRYELQLSLVDDGATIAAHWDYARHLFRPATVKSMLAAFERLLTGFAAAPRTPPGKVSFDAPAPAAAGAPQPTEPRPHATIVQAFAAAVAAHPDRVAIQAGGRKLSYRDLDRISTAFAGRLRGRGVQPGDAVGLALPDSAPAVAAIVAILKAGGAYVPLGADWPAQRICSAVRQANVKVLVVDALPDQAVGDAVAALSLTPVELALDPAPAQAAGEHGTAAEPVVSTLQPAYVIFTSGSTGEPKGVVATHANVLDLFRKMQAELAITAADVWVLKHALTFDYSVWEMWGALLHGGTLVIPEPVCDDDLSALARVIATTGVTIVNLTPSFFDVFEPQLAKVIGDSAVRALIFSGEVLNLRRLADWLAQPAAGDIALWNIYGITENTVFSTSHRIRSLDDAGPASPIGRPLPNGAAHVLDATLKRAPAGVTAELFLGGAGVTQGYVGAPGLTASRFVPDPFAADGRRMYRSGDLVRARPDGGLEYVERNDSQVKLRGYRINCADVEANLERSALLRKAKVAVAGAGTSHPVLVAFVTVGDEAPGRDAEATARLEARIGLDLADRVPAFMLPGRIVVVPALPLNASGKVDIDALLALAARKPATGAADQVTEPTTAGLLAIFARHLGAAGLRPDESFFEAGANSLLLLEIKESIAAELNATVSVLDLFRYHTVGMLAEFLRSGTPAQPVGHAKLRSSRRQAALARFKARATRRPGG